MRPRRGESVVALAAQVGAPARGASHGKALWGRLTKRVWGVVGVLASLTQQVWAWLELCGMCSLMHLRHHASRLPEPSIFCMLNYQYIQLFCNSFHVKYVLDSVLPNGQLGIETQDNTAGSCSSCSCTTAGTLQESKFWNILSRASSACLWQTKKTLVVCSCFSSSVMKKTEDLHSLHSFTCKWTQFILITWIMQSLFLGVYTARWGTRRTVLCTFSFLFC